MKSILISMFIFLNLFANDWNAIYEAKKDEILKEFEKLDSARQELEAYRAATKALFDKREESLLKKESDINKTLEEINRQKESIENLVSKNEQILSELKTITSDKVLQVYEKMKDAPAAGIISSLPREEAVKILYALNPKKISSILSKTDPAVAAELTSMLRKSEIFMEDNATK
ncbi:MotE family protein [Campylobacter hyointestinalis]|uniref:5'-nucleosidase n=2 Tax=Campylobacter hyointestinalis TaxID=198 RepID=A0AAV6EI25_CAMHY|nr:5'-nucleosidase [Campylobacter hyointestinalis]ANE34957.1 putative motility protein chaperone MotE [Campylobacter hyointestinalis subsp. lawsonii CCUG 27631]KAB0614400.1 5'-nucleosidase [Campylobacter hyointestinalis subsp. lawsonii]QKF70155.1 putative motility protein chaperone MotE [Campylobacter hyointestinalis subsp. lawsonii]RAZ25194.1 5'-nucleosidase [Campylobacter hyointestinalis subsp. lawsonii]RAZ27482.1 5'-nucleosidase [Campylobacter hyointestinalis subsp. lawsonii]